MAPWTAFSHSGDYPFDAARVRKEWRRLHAGDLEPLPEDEALLAAWALYHTGEFEKATEAGLQAGPAGTHVANKATCVYAHYLEPREKNRQRLFLQVAERAAALAAEEPDNANARALLGEVYLDSGDPLSAEKELRRARTLVSRNDFRITWSGAINFRISRTIKAS